MKPLQAIALYLRDRAGWEALCARCGRCCFEREVTADGTVVVNYGEPCDLLDMDTHLCKAYDRRFALCSRCRRLTPLHALFSPYLPEECAYVRAFRLS